MQLNTNISATASEINQYVNKLDNTEQQKILKALKILEAKKLAKKLSTLKANRNNVDIDVICEIIRKVRKSNAKLQNR